MIPQNQLPEFLARLFLRLRQGDGVVPRVIGAYPRHIGIGELGMLGNVRRESDETLGILAQRLPADGHGIGAGGGVEGATHVGHFTGNVRALARGRALQEEVGRHRGQLHFVWSLVNRPGLHLDAHRDLGHGAVAHHAQLDPVRQLDGSPRRQPVILGRPGGGRLLPLGERRSGTGHQAGGENRYRSHDQSPEPDAGALAPGTMV